MRLLGFTPTKKMLEEASKGLPQDKKVEAPTVNNVVKPTVKPTVVPDVVPDVTPDVVLDVVPDVSQIPSVEIPSYTTYTTSTMVMPSKKKSSSELKRKVTLDPLSN